MPLNYDSPGELKAFLEERGLAMRKKWSQNFLINRAVRFRLLEALKLKPGDPVWEIGPGLGAMTEGLLEREGKVCAFEIDPAFAKALDEIFGHNPDFTLIKGDVLKTWPQVQAKPGEELFLMGNLPYHIAAALLGDFIEKGRFFTRMVVTVQREVAQRMAAAVDTENYSSFSVLCSSVYIIKALEVIKGSSFYPVPRVDSQGMVLEYSRRDLPELFHPLVRSLFSSRRKMIGNTLPVFISSVLPKQGLSPGLAKDLAADVLKKADIPRDRRPETLDVDEFAALAKHLKEIV